MSLMVFGHGEWGVGSGEWVIGIGRLEGKDLLQRNSSHGALLSIILPIPYSRLPIPQCLKHPSEGNTEVNQKPV